MPKKRSEEGSIIAYFSLKPLEVAESLLMILNELVRVRRREGKPRIVRNAKTATVVPTPVSSGGGTITH